MKVETVVIDTLDSALMRSFNLTKFTGLTIKHQGVYHLASVTRLGSLFPKPTHKLRRSAYGVLGFRPEMNISQQLFQNK